MHIQEREELLRQMALLDVPQAVSALSAGRETSPFSPITDVDITSDGRTHRVAEQPRAGKHPDDRPTLRLGYDEMMHLRRLVHLATTTIGELNLWLVTAGKPIDDEDR